MKRVVSSVNDIGWKHLYRYNFPVWALANAIRRRAWTIRNRKVKEDLAFKIAYWNYCKQQGISPYEQADVFFTDPGKWLAEHNVKLEMQRGKE